MRRLWEGLGGVRKTSGKKCGEQQEALAFMETSVLLRCPAMPVSSPLEIDDYLLASIDAYCLRTSSQTNSGWPTKQQ